MAAAPPPAMDDALRFYTETQLATKALLRQANDHRIAQARYEAPSFADQLGRDLDAPRKRRRPKKAVLGLTSASDPGAAAGTGPDDDRLASTGEPPRPSTAEAKPSRLAGLLGLGRRRLPDDAPRPMGEKPCQNQSETCLFDGFLLCAS